MLRKMLWGTLVMVFLFANIAYGAKEVSRANTSQKGSILIFPKIQTAGDAQSDTVAVDTIITLGNDYYEDVSLKCSWVDENQSITLFNVKLGANRPLAFSAWSGSALSGSELFPAFKGIGQMLCWAVDTSYYAQIQFNHLYGTALIQYSASTGFAPSPVPSMVSYNAWAFKALKDPGPAQGGTAGLLPLDGKSYDACPSYLVANYIPGEKLLETLPVQAELTLSPCRQDLRQDRTPTCTKAIFDIWDAMGNKATGAFQCLADRYEGLLERIGNDPRQKGPGAGGEKFTFGDSPNLRTTAARFRVYSAASSLCTGTVGCPAGSQVASPFVGLLTYQLEYPESIPDRVPFTGFTLQGAGADTTGFVRWDADPKAAPIPIVSWLGGLAGVPVTFDGSRSYDTNACHGALPCLDDQIVSYEWDLNGDGTFNGVEDGTPVVDGNYARVTKTFEVPTTGTATLRVTDSYGLVGQATRSFTILPNPLVIDQDYAVCSETVVNKFVTNQVIKVLFRNTGNSASISNLEAKLTSVPSNFTKIIRGKVDVDDYLMPGKEVWSPCGSNSGIKLKLDSRVTEPAGEWRWTVRFKYNGQAYTLYEVPMQ